MKGLKVYNSLSRQIEGFVPINRERVTMYVCGPTVYDTPHLGNARPAVVFDVLFRLLRSLYPRVEYARNITDIDDKIMERAAKNGEAISALTARTTAEYHQIVDTLGCLRPSHEPTATGAINDIIEMIRELIAKEVAYSVTKGEGKGHVLFHIPEYPEHGALSRHEQEDLRAGNRVAVEGYKWHPGDFVLWKPSSDDQPGWDSPWGRGRPGWHIECSAMIRRVLGYTIDIHGGGSDLRFPHHDCEISQSQCANGVPLARYWLHNGMVLIDGQKMAKSAGNFFTIRDLIDQGANGEAIRLGLLMTHYRSPLDWKDNAATAAGALGRWYDAMLPYRNVKVPDLDSDNPVQVALLNDLNTPEAITAMHGLVSDLNRAVTDQERHRLAGQILYGAHLLGIMADLTSRDQKVLSPEAKSLLDAREQARDRKDWTEADVLRDKLNALGILVKDTKQGTLWWYA